MVLQGLIDETCDLRGIYSTGGRVRLDLGKVTQVNSGGVRIWIEAHLNRNPETTIVLKKCSPAVVSQINLVSIFSQHHEIESILGPYFCPKCKRESLQEMEVSALRDGKPLPFTCAECGTDLVFDELPDEYLNFAVDD